VFDSLLIVTQGWPDDHVGGTEYQTFALAERIAAAGTRVEVWTRRLRRPRRSPGVDLKDFGRFPATFALRLPFRARHLTPRSVYAPLISSHTWMLSRILDRRSRFVVKVGCSGAAGDVETSLATAWGARKLRDVFRRADAIVIPDASIAGELLAAGCRDAILHVIPNGVDMVRFAPRPDRGPGRRVLFAGRLETQKGADLLPRIWPAAPFGMTLRIVGEGSEKDRLMAWARGRSDVEFFPFSTSVEEHYADSSVLLLPSRCEGLSNALLEALASGLNVIASDLPSNRRVADAIGPSCQVLPLDPETWRRRISEVLQQPASLDRERLDGFSLERSVREYRRVLELG
jgi:glycosyltransferase involved in cell wall biosynthesis